MTYCEIGQSFSNSLLQDKYLPRVSKETIHIFFNVRFFFFLFLQGFVRYVSKKIISYDFQSYIALKQLENTGIPHFIVLCFTAFHRC